MGTPRNLETQNSHPIQDAGCAEKACWFLQQQSEARKEELLALPGDNECSFLSGASSPDRRRDDVCDKGRTEKGVFFLQDTAVAGES